MIKVSKFILIFLFISGVLAAQQIYFSDSYTEDGEPIGAKNIWEIKPWGSFVYVFLDNKGEILTGPILYMFVDRMNADSSYEPFDSKAINISYNQKWAVYNYKFALPGKYEVYFIDRNQNKLASEKIIVQYEESNYSKNTASSSSYYENCKVLFCEKILVGGQPLGIRRSISLSKNGSNIYIVLNNYAPLKTAKLLIDVWRKKNRAFDYDEYVQSKKYSLNPDWPDAYLKYEFDKQGEYKISIYNEDEVYIKSGYITVYE